MLFPLNSGKMGKSEDAQNTYSLPFMVNYPPLLTPY